MKGRRREKKVDEGRSWRWSFFPLLPTRLPQERTANHWRGSDYKWVIRLGYIGCLLSAGSESVFFFSLGEFFFFFSCNGRPRCIPLCPALEGKEKKKTQAPPPTDHLPPPTMTPRLMVVTGLFGHCCSHCQTIHSFK